MLSGALGRIWAGENPAGLSAQSVPGISLDALGPKRRVLVTEWVPEIRARSAANRHVMFWNNRCSNPVEHLPVDKYKTLDAFVW